MVPCSMLVLHAMLTRAPPCPTSARTPAALPLQLGLSSNDPELQKAALLYYTEHASTVVRGRL